MFSGIIEHMAQVVRIEQDQTNKHFTLRNPFVNLSPAGGVGGGLTIDQSIAHNGVCLTVVSTSPLQGESEGASQPLNLSASQPSSPLQGESEGAYYVVTAMQETLDRTNLNDLQVGDYVNLERAMSMDKLLDGHIVQGHVDQIATCVEARETEGSWYYRFEYESSPEMIRRGYFCVDKGSVAINGVSLTACTPEVIGNKGYVSVCIIPYTHEVTNFKYIRVGTRVNIEFDIIGKYLARMNTLLNEN